MFSGTLSEFNHKRDLPSGSLADIFGNNMNLRVRLAAHVDGYSTRQRNLGKFKPRTRPDLSLLLNGGQLPTRSVRLGLQCFTIFLQHFGESLSVIDKYLLVIQNKLVLSLFDAVSCIDDLVSLRSAADHLSPLQNDSSGTHQGSDRNYACSPDHHLVRYGWT